MLLFYTLKGWAAPAKLFICFCLMVFALSREHAQPTFAEGEAPANEPQHTLAVAAPAAKAEFIQKGEPSLALDSVQYSPRFVVGQPYSITLQWHSTANIHTPLASTVQLFIGNRRLIASSTQPVFGAEPIHENATTSQVFELSYDDFNALWFAQGPLSIELSVHDANNQTRLRMRDANGRWGGSYNIAWLTGEELQAKDCLPTERPQLNNSPPLSLTLPASGQLYHGFWFAHHGIDLVNNAGTPVRAALAGRVDMADWNDQGYGLLVKLVHEDVLTAQAQPTSTVESLYGHLERITVRTGQWVKAGQLIGFMGSTGRSSGPHLHFEFRLNGAPQNPLCYLPPIQEV